MASAPAPVAAAVAAAAPAAAAEKPAGVGGISMSVVKRDGSREWVSFDKITSRIATLLDLPGLPRLGNVDAAALGQKVIRHVYDGVRTSELDEQTAVTAAAMSTLHPDYESLASRVTVSNNQKTAPATFLASVCAQLANVDSAGEAVPLLAGWLLPLVEEHSARIEVAIYYSRDFRFSYFGFKTRRRGTSRARCPRRALRRRSRSARSTCGCAWRWASTARTLTRRWRLTTSC